MLKKPAIRRSRIAAATGSVIATAALTLGGLNAIAPTDTMGAEIRYADFEGKFKSAAKPLEVTGQWAISEYRANSNATVVANSPYSSSPQNTVMNLSACAHGGLGTKCDDDNTRSGARIALGRQAEEDWTPRGFGLAAMYWQIWDTTTTKVVCRPDGTVEGFEPEWGIRYGNASHYFSSPKGMKELRYTDENKAMDSNPLQSNKVFNRLKSGETYTEIHKGTNRADTYLEFSVTPSWGSDNTRKEAWSELTITAQAFYQTSRSQQGPEWTYTFSSRCGLTMNDNTGSKGPSTSTVSSGAVLPEVDVESGAEIPAEGLTEDAVAALENAAGFGRPEDLEHNGAVFQAEATRELTDEDREYISGVLDAAASVSDTEGMVDEGAWIRRQANGLPVVTLELPGGGYARVTPKLELSLPELAVEETTTNADTDGDAVETNSEEVE